MQAIGPDKILSVRRISIMRKTGLKEVKTHGYYKAAFFEVVWNLWNWKNISDRFEHARALKLGMIG
jgi:hypothetical protein